MAPSSTSAKPRKPASGKAGGPRPIVPAIPLPYVKRQAAVRAAAAAQLITEPSTPTPATLSVSPSTETVNGHASGPQASEASQPILMAESVSSANGPALSNIEKADVPLSNEANLLDNGPTDDSASTLDSTNASSDPPLSSAPGPKHEDEKPVDLQLSQSSPSHSHSHTPTSASGDSTLQASYDQVTTASAAMNYNVKEGRARPPAHISPAHHQMPIPFHPANRLPPGMSANGDMARVPPHPAMPNGPPMHHSHPSNSSTVQFGLYGSSANSSPAPPHSGGIAPPPGMSLNDGRAPYMGPPGNGYPPMMPVGSDMVPVTHYDGFARPAMAYAPPEPFQAYGNNFGPSTPHSVHGSQSSGHHDEPSAHNPPYIAGHSRQDRNGFSQDFQAYAAEGRVLMDRNYPRGVAHPLGLPIQEGNPDGLSDYIKQQFGNTEFSDCVVELRYSDSRAAPVRVPGHRIILARSPALAAIIRRQPPEQRTLILETDNKWIRSDAFYMNLQRLYGLPLIPVIPYPDFANDGSLAEAGSLDEKMDFSLAYAAAGKLLQWETGIRRGCEVAAHILDWQNIEKALAFALEGFIDHGTFDSYKYEVGSKILVEKIVHFILRNIPRTFSLDVTVPEYAPYSRLPLDPGVKPKVSSEGTASFIVPGSQNAGKGHRHQLSNIQFGDLSLIEGANGSASETPKASQQARPTSHVTLSRILLSVPFSVLQLIVERTNEAGIGEPYSSAIKDAISEREARRKRVIEAVVEGHVVDNQPILQELRSPEPRALGRWGVLGWQEEISTNHDGLMPTLVRRWVPLRDGHEPPAAEFP